ncbi:MAG: CatB-related O-acetyltransferase [Mucinivorans sp.]
MIFFSTIRLLISDWFEYCRQTYQRARFLKANPTCRIGKGSQVSQTSFGRYVVAFNDVRLYAAKIGDYTYIQTQGRIFNCSIGKFCSIAAGVTIAAGIHHIDYVSTHPAMTQQSTPLPRVYATNNNTLVCEKVNIGNDVWIGEKAIVLDGVNIGNGAVIAAGAVVVRDVAPYSVVGGIPAKHIKYRFDEQTIAAIESTSWWDKSDEWLATNADYFLDTKQFLRRCV